MTDAQEVVGRIDKYGDMPIERLGDMRREIAAALNEAHEAGRRQGREEAALWHEQQAAYYLSAARLQPDSHAAAPLMDRASLHADDDRAIRALALAPDTGPAPAAERGGWQPTHRHYKGGLYRLLRDDLTIEATMEPAVLYDDEHGSAWVRAKRDFNQVDIDRFGGPRFAPLPSPPTEGGE